MQKLLQGLGDRTLLSNNTDEQPIGRPSKHGRLYQYHTSQDEKIDRVHHDALAVLTRKFCLNWIIHQKKDVYWILMWRHTSCPHFDSWSQTETTTDLLFVVKAFFFQGATKLAQNEHPQRLSRLYEKVLEVKKIGFQKSINFEHLFRLTFWKKEVCLEHFVSYSDLFCDFGGGWTFSKVELQLLSPVKIGRTGTDG